MKTNKFNTLVGADEFKDKAKNLAENEIEKGKLEVEKSLEHDKDILKDVSTGDLVDAKEVSHEELEPVVETTITAQDIEKTLNIDTSLNSDLPLHSNDPHLMENKMQNTKEEIILRDYGNYRNKSVFLASIGKDSTFTDIVEVLKHITENSELMCEHISDQTSASQIKTVNNLVTRLLERVKSLPLTADLILNK